MQTNPVANHLLWMAYSKNEDDDITPRKVQRLMYFLHGWFLAITKQSLLDEPFIRGEHGPFLASLQRELHRYSGVPVDEYILDVDSKAGELRPFFVSYAAVPQFEAILKKVWAEYGHLPVERLSSMAHASGSPWAQTRLGQPIETIRIYEDFVRQGAANEARRLGT